MDEILGALFAVMVGMMYMPQVTNAINTSRHAMTDVTTAQEQQQWATAVSTYVSQYMTTLESTATATTPVTLSVATVQAANVGLPTNFSGTNPFNQTWTAQVLQPAAGTLQVLAFGSGGNIIKDQELGQIARAAAGSGGFIPTNNSGAYSGATANAYGTYGAWKIPTSGYSVGSGGSPATLLMFTNGTLSSNYLYRVAVPGQPQLNTMSTTLDMGSNSITNANGVSTAGGSNAASFQAGQVTYYGDSAGNAAIRGGSLSIQNAAGTAPADIVGVGNITSSGTVSASGSVNVGGDIWTAGTVTATSVSTALDVDASRNVNAAGYVWSNGQVIANGTIVSYAGASIGGGCSPNGAIANSGSEPLFCKNGAWSAPGGGLYITTYSIPNNSTVGIGAHVYCAPLDPGGDSWGQGQLGAPAGTNSFGSQLWNFNATSQGNNPVVFICLDQQN